MDKIQIEHQNRIEALGNAVRHRQPGDTADDVVGQAAKYFEFLQGKSLKVCSCTDGTCSHCYAGAVTDLPRTQVSDDARYEAHVEMEREAHAEDSHR